MEPEKSSPSSAQGSLWPLVLLGILAVASWCRSKSQTPDKQSINSIPPQTNSADKGEAAQNFMALSSQSAPTPTQTEQPCKCCHHKAPLWKIVLEVGTLIAAIVYAGITYRMWRQMERTAKDTNDAFRVDERAWVTVEPIKPVQLTPEDATFPAAFTCDIYPKNVGKTVATDIIVKAETNGSGEEFGRNAEGMNNMQDKYLLGQFKEMGTNKPIIVRSNPVPRALPPNSISPAPFRLTCQAPQIFPNGTQFLHYMIGRIDYCDQFQVRHWTKFCYYVVNRRGEVWNCQEGNDADHNPENPDDKAIACHTP